MHISAQKTWALIAILLVTALACESPTPVAPADSGLSISVNPARIETTDGTAEVKVIARKADGSAVNAGTEINFSTNLGSVDPAIARTDSRGVAITTLSGDGTVGTATVEASSGAAALVSIEVQIGSLPVDISLVANPNRIGREGGSVRLVSVVRDDLNNPLEGVVVRFGTEAGTLASGGGALETNRRGEARDTLTLTSFDVGGVPDGFFLATVSAVGPDGELTNDVEIGIGGFVTAVRLTASPSTVSPSGGEFVLTATVQTDGDELAEGVGVFFGTDVGTLGSQGRQQFTDFEGVATDSLTLTAVDLDAFAGSVINVSATVTGLGGEDITDVDQILVSNSVGFIFLEASQVIIDPVTTDPTTVTLTATVFDEASIGLEGAGVVFRSTPTCVPPITICGAGFLLNEGQILVSNANGQVSTTLTVSAGDVTDGMGLQETATITVTVETLLLGVTLEDSVPISVDIP